MGERDVNFRTVGQRPTGKIAKGAASRINGNVSSSEAPSIPGKYETFLFSNATREVNAFGTQAPRFVTPDFGQSPGPATRNVREDMLSNLQNNPSYGVKGTGSFASSSKRGVRIFLKQIFRKRIFRREMFYDYDNQ